MWNQELISFKSMKQRNDTRIEREMKMPIDDDIWNEYITNENCNESTELYEFEFAYGFGGKGFS